jgi:hypothetical protein
MAPKTRIATKREREQDPGSSDVPSLDAKSKSKIVAQYSKDAQGDTRLLAAEKKEIIEGTAMSILRACRAALVESPAASRAALARYRARIDPALARALEVVASYKIEVVDVVFSFTCFHF